MRVRIPHSCSKEEALVRVKKALDEARPQFKEKVVLHEEKWEDSALHFDLTVEGQRIRGTLTIEDDAYALDAKLPLMLKMFEGRIEKAIQEQVGKVL
jgi:hypothetical protein